MFYRVAALLLCILLNLNPVLLAGVTARASNEQNRENICPHAELTSTLIEYQFSESKIENINDGKDDTAFCTDPDLKKEIEYPQYIILDFKDRFACTDGITLISFCALQYGIANIDIEYWKNGDWVTAAAEHALAWKSSAPKNESIDIKLDNVKSTKLRLRINCSKSSKVLQLNELKVYGHMERTAESIAQGISLTSPRKGDTRLSLPEVAEGYEVSLKSSDHKNVVSLKGKIAPQDKDMVIGLVLNVRSKNDKRDSADSRKINITVPAKIPEGYARAAPEEDMKNFIKNPAMGWVLYVDTAGGDNFPKADEYWKEIDSFKGSGKASVFYLRIAWSYLEPEEGKYAWNENENYKALIKGALDRGLKLAFRVYKHSIQTPQQATPQWVREAGAKGYYDYNFSTNTDMWNPYVYNKIFQSKFESFLTAFAKEYDNPDIVDYIDGNGLGWWGETHWMNKEYLTFEQKEEVYLWIINAYASRFKNVLLGDQYQYNAFDYPLRDWALKSKGYVIRRDSIGSPHWTQDERDRIGSHFPFTPLFAESYYHHYFTQAYWKPDFPELRKMLEHVLNQAEELHANTLDLRVTEDAREWVTNNMDLVDHFIVNGGYRFVLTDITYPERIKRDGEYTIFHNWKNTAVGKLPNDTPNWGYKYKVAFALLDTKTGEPVKILVDSAEPSQWIRGKTFNYSSKCTFSDVSPGEYDFAAAIADTTKNNSPSINLAIKNSKSSAGWYKIGSVKIMDSLSDSMIFIAVSVLALASAALCGIVLFFIKKKKRV